LQRCVDSKDQWNLIAVRTSNPTYVKRRYAKVACILIPASLYSKRQKQTIGRKSQLQLSEFTLLLKSQYRMPWNKPSNRSNESHPNAVTLSHYAWQQVWGQNGVPAVKPLVVTFTMDNRATVRWGEGWEFRSVHTMLLSDAAPTALHASTSISRLLNRNY
jgi:hypothetical protein